MAFNWRIVCFSYDEKLIDERKKTLNDAGFKTTTTSEGDYGVVTYLWTTKGKVNKAKKLLGID